VLLQQGLALGVVFAGDLVVMPRSTVGLHHDLLLRPTEVWYQPTARK